MNHDIKTKRRNLKELQEEIENMTCRLSELNDVVENCKIE